eukprot:469537-Rhodomonas_salina.1
MFRSSQEQVGKFARKQKPDWHLEVVPMGLSPRLSGLNEYRKLQGLLCATSQLPVAWEQGRSGSRPAKSWPLVWSRIEATNYSNGGYKLLWRLSLTNYW